MKQKNINGIESYNISLTHLKNRAIIDIVSSPLILNEVEFGFIKRHFYLDVI